MWPFKKVERQYPIKGEPYPLGHTCVECGHLVATDRAVGVEHINISYIFTADGRPLSTWKYFCEEHAPPYRKVTSYSDGTYTTYTRDRIERTHYCIDGTALRNEYIS